ncbi:PFD1-like protein [Mya arenaria]|uniref:PFD1-like protein n=1 Tax=Mya arenaria TaxID=6604 RepID=A0ABY7DJX0_MYAAR|nr:prefoldin subunit 1-like [Mya arenaria]WAQ96990.1 PFD1-like protein [Mya arenaria]
MASSKATGQKSVDLELKKAFQELQGKMIMTQQQLKISDAQIETLKRTVTRNLLVEKELGRLPENTRVYEGVGRMFMLAPIPNVLNTLGMKNQAAESKIKTIEGNKTYLERNMKESEDSLRELVLSKTGR